MLHLTAQERYQKLKRVFARLMYHFTQDDLDDFIQVANSLDDWIKKDPVISKDQRRLLHKFVVPKSIDWQTCHQVANAQKHMTGKPPPQPGAPIIKAIHCQIGASRGVIHHHSGRLVGVGDEITIEYADGSSDSALAFVIRTFKHLHFIFEIEPVPLEQRIIPTFDQLLNGLP